MPELLRAAPARRPELVLKPLGETGKCVVKDHRTGAYFQLGPEESFLLSLLDGKRTPETLRDAFEERFGEEVSLDDIDDFLDSARKQGFLQSNRGGASGLPDKVLHALRTWPVPGAPSEPESLPAQPPRRPRVSSQNLFFWRISLYDPDRLFNWLEPRMRFVWTRPFVVVSAALILLAMLLVWVGSQELVAQIPRMVGWQGIALTVLVVGTVTLCHEFAHGLTCKHHGGEVHEVGFLLLYFMPSFYCNVSDAWLIAEKSKRLWVTLAGGYCDLLLWAIGVFVWRVTLPGCLINYTAWTVLSVCGVRVLLNFNPLIKLDGYYIVTDLLEVANLYKSGRKAVIAHWRSLLWGAPRPDPVPHGRILFWYGLASWLLSLVLVGTFLLGAGRVLSASVGVAGLGWTALIGFMSIRRLFRGVIAGEIKTMIVSRRKRTATWALILAVVSFMMVAIPITDRAGGQFALRPERRIEVRAPIAGFLRDVTIDEGSRVSPGAPLVRLEVIDLVSKIAQKNAEVHESQAKLRLLKVGPRPEEVAEERLRVERTTTWRDLARTDLVRSAESLRGELAELDQQVRQYQLERDGALDVYNRDKALMARQAVQLQQLRESDKKLRVFESQLKQAEARQSARRAEGTLKAEAELARRETELADARAKVRLLDAGTRPEEIDAESAHLARLEEELRFLEAQSKRLPLFSPTAGVVVTPWLKEKVGRYFHEGELICEIESLATLEAEVTVTEQDALRVRPGQPVVLKARALPYQTFPTTVERIASSMARPLASETAATASPSLATSPTTIVLYCRVNGLDSELRTGMTGYARIDCGSRSIGAIVLDRVLRVLRTEYWW